jgi:putative colanic acid biosynthesis UDP-glucose lipid carrier transferase
MKTALRLSAPWMRYVAWLFDVLLIASAGYAIYIWRHQALDAAEGLEQVYAALIGIAGLLLAVFSDSVYKSWRVNNLGVMLRSIVVVWTSIWLMLLLGLFLTKYANEVSRFWFVVWGGGALITLLLQRLLVYLALRWLRKQGYNFKTVLLVGNGAMKEQVTQAIEAAAWSGLRIVGQISVADLSTYAKLPEDEQPQEIWLCIPLSDESGIKQAMDLLRFSLANIRLVPDWFSLKLLNHGISEAVGIPMLDLSHSPVTGMVWLLKAIEDRVLAGVIFIVISPLMILIALAIKLTSPGPVFFKQKRHGWNGEVINVYKFRSMLVHKEANEQITQAVKSDARVTPLGGFLRRTSLDELPQFINVLQGRMSIVGPRPHAVEHNEHYKEKVPRYMLRHKVKPGITGWAQIHGFRGETDTLEKMKKRVEYDLYYIEHMSIWLDLQIIATTILKGFIHRNAY